MKTDRYKSEYINALRNAFYDSKALEIIGNPLKNKELNQKVFILKYFPV